MKIDWEEEAVFLLIRTAGQFKQIGMNWILDNVMSNTL
jgi:hypothetical protein